MLLSCYCLKNACEIFGSMYLQNFVSRGTLLLICVTMDMTLPWHVWLDAYLLIRDVCIIKMIIAYLLLLVAKLTVFLFGYDADVSRLHACNHQWFQLLKFLGFLLIMKAWVGRSASTLEYWREWGFGVHGWANLIYGFDVLLSMPVVPFWRQSLHCRYYVI